MRKLAVFLLLAILMIEAAVIYVGGLEPRANAIENSVEFATPDEDTLAFARGYAWGQAYAQRELELGKLGWRVSARQAALAEALTQHGITMLWIAEPEFDPATLGSVAGYNEAMRDAIIERIQDPALHALLT